MSHRAVIFDLGGVIFDTPIHAILEFERDVGLPPRSIGTLIDNSGANGAWARLERGQLPYQEFLAEFQLECSAAGVQISVPDMMAAVERALELHPRMLAAVRSLRHAGFLVGALTNNWQSNRSGDAQFAELECEFEAYIQSYKVGLRKPEPEIYHIVCDALSVRPAEAVFLDDIGRNLKAARALGMSTIKVHDPDGALAELEELLAPAWNAPSGPRSPRAVRVRGGG